MSRADKWKLNLSVPEASHSAGLDRPVCSSGATHIVPKPHPTISAAICFFVFHGDAKIVTRKPHDLGLASFAPPHHDKPQPEPPLGHTHTAFLYRQQTWLNQQASVITRYERATSSTTADESPRLGPSSPYDPASTTLKHPGESREVAPNAKMSDGTGNFSHFRYYENKYPEIDEFVMYVNPPARPRTNASC